MSSAAGSNPEAYLSAEPARADIDASRGAVLLEFGSPTCGHCLRAQPLIAQALASSPPVQRLKIADGSGRPLGRSFGVKLWPTLVFLRDGREVVRLVRPTAPAPIAAALAQIIS
jgi:thioredoxin 1